MNSRIIVATLGLKSFFEVLNRFYIRWDVFELILRHFVTNISKMIAKKMHKFSLVIYILPLLFFTVFNWKVIFKFH